MKIAHGTIVMAADGEKILLFSNEGDQTYTVLKTLAHEEEEHPATHEMGSDRPGRTRSSTEPRRAGYGDTDWHRQAEERFARRAAELLEEAAQRTEAGVVIIAPPRFLGCLRDQLGDAVRRKVIAEIDKDLVHHETDDVADAIARHPAKAPAP